MNILGAAITNHDDSICFIKDGELKSHIQLERYTKIKHNRIYDANKHNRIYANETYIEKDYKKMFELYDNFCGNLKNIDIICISFNSHSAPLFKTNDRKKYLYHKIKLLKNENLELYDKKIKKSIITIKKLENFIRYKDKIYYIDHHQAHAAYGLYTSNFKESDVLSYDGSGINYQTVFFNSSGKLYDVGIRQPQLMNKFKKDLTEKEFEKVPENTLECGIGPLWWLFCDKIFGIAHKSGTAMALASYGKPNEKIMEIFDDITLNSKTKYIVEFAKEKNYLDFNYYADMLNEYNKDKVLFTLFASLQHYSTEKVLNSLIKNKTSDNLCISGGCALNGYINEEILKRKIYKKIHVPPAAGDEGQSLGCALHALYNLEGTKIDFHKDIKKLIYLGEAHKIEKNKYNVFLEDEKLFKLIAKKISEGYVVGWYQGRSESGPRALGNRSILADPRNPHMKDHINFKIKKREWFRPFAPSILRECVIEWFETNGDPDSHFMTRIMQYKNGKEKLVPATNHIDNTARIQTVEEKINPRYYKLIKEFYNLTKTPILLNTSFNGKGEPMVETVDDAIKCFKKNNIDILVTGNYVYYRNNDENIKPFIEESNVDGNDR